MSVYFYMYTFQICQVKIRRIKTLNITTRQNPRVGPKQQRQNKLACGSSKYLALEMLSHVSPRSQKADTAPILQMRKWWLRV